MTLWEIPAKNSAQIDALSQALNPAVAARLSEMGFTPGQDVYCLRRSPLQGPLVVQLGDCVYSLERDVANQIHLAHAS
ncbi:FeoA family protein [Bowmanella sp. JS7-9]|uniref:Ferrous iron transport protein A n=1 Tax=Pseudobowmanella zhangzhouensis TaxID=1537679 RepID=A0ABW1XQI2_9ALTE|nr:FeoA family protein [Bowmanella sp. JS7-9]TBX24422.1 iron transporter FeoA [Bowmanella sp. JS7-9]